MDAFRKRVNRCTQKMQCSLCAAVLLPKEMGKHYKYKHKLDTVRCCIWCDGAITWNWKEKNKHLSHLNQCFSIALQRPITTQNPTLNLPVLEINKKPICDIQPMCPEKDFFEHAPLANLPPQAYQHINLPPKRWKTEEVLPRISTYPGELTFMGNIELASDYVQIFLGTGEYLWYHIMVSGIAMPSFLEAVQRHPDQIFVMPFWCWCNGGKKTDPYKRQHRHMIVASRGDLFIRQVWPHVTYPKEQNRPRFFYCKRYKKIESWTHLVNTIGYVSKRQSKCQFSFINENKIRAKNQHFYIAASLPKTFDLCIATQVKDNGLLELLNHKFKHLSPDPFLDKVFRFNQSWCVHIKHIAKQLYTVLTVEKHWEPIILPPWANHSSNAYMYLLEGHRLYFKENRDLIDWPMEKWSQHQMERGNCFCNNIGDCQWKFAYHQQKTLNAVHYFKTHELEKLKYEAGYELKVLTDKIEVLTNENEVLTNNIKQLEEEKVKSLMDRIKQLQDDKEYLKSRAIHGDQELKRCREELKQRDKEIQTLKNNLLSQIIPL